MKSAFFIALFTITSVTAMAQDAAWCVDLNQAAMAEAAGGHLAEAEAALMAAAAPGGALSQSDCPGHVLWNMAGIMSISGRIAESERLAEESVRILEKFYPPDDWVLLRPLHLIAAARLESGKTARAREAVKRIQSIRIEHPEDSAIVHATLGALLQIEGRRREAEAEYHDSLRAWEQAGRSESADAAAIHHCLGSLYLEEQRLEEAGRALDRALAIFSRAKDAVPLDRAKILHLRGVLDGRLGEWRQSEQELCDALAIFDREPSVDPSILRSLLANYSYVLRRNHHGRQARSIEARIGALPANRATPSVVDFTELMVERKAAKR